MKFTLEPKDLEPLAAGCLPRVWDALLEGVDFANRLQPEADNRDQWFWAHAARFAARNHLASVATGATGWELVPGIPNSGIHVRIPGNHTIRVLRSSGGTTPAPGGTKRRLEYWLQRCLQLPLDIGGIQPANLVLDWMNNDDGSLTMHIGMPRGSWRYRKDPILDWRIPVLRDGDLGALSFAPTGDGGLPSLLQIDEEEKGAM